ncbi:MAG: hypothetical protein U0807_19445 [Candidatus Binatia bacterium]
MSVMFLAQEIIVGPSSCPTEEIGANARAFRQLGLSCEPRRVPVSNGMPWPRRGRGLCRHRR